MKEQRVTYAELKLAKVSKRPQVKPKESKSSTTVTEQGVTYAELSLHNAARDPQENGKSCHLRGLAAPPEKRIAGILGLTCLALICIIVPVWINLPVATNPEQNDFSTVTNIEKACHCGPCPREWIMYSNSCYYFGAEKKTWKESVTACQSNNSQLLYIDTEEELKLMNSISVASWIGVHRNDSDQPWKLLNGSTSQLKWVLVSVNCQHLSPLFVRVSISLPADPPLPPGQITAEVLGIICLVLVSTVIKTIVLTPEQNDFSPVTNIQKACHCDPCPKEWITYSNNCYYFGAERKTWRESVTACQSKKSQLLYIDTEEEMKFMKSISVVSWIGVYRNDSGQPWMFLNGSASQLEIREIEVAIDQTAKHCGMLQSNYYAENCEAPNLYYCKHKP
ncbi:NKG2-C type II integral membrane protein-like [Talpa occidentalis]|uniref:NKG2-C type II integral membrane protein-like n=1 Tax=Talpa occidentalis TaxID=50954 RepID=UPI0023F74BDE|nr:NKG2-C type II integral membrane protein-like [Talpa occidentalis]